MLNCRCVRLTAPGFRYCDGRIWRWRHLPFLWVITSSPNANAVSWYRGFNAGWRTHQTGADPGAFLRKPRLRQHRLFIRSLFAGVLGCHRRIEMKTEIADNISRQLTSIANRRCPSLSHWRRGKTVIYLAFDEASPPISSTVLCLHCTGSSLLPRVTGATLLNVIMTFAFVGISC